MDTNPPLQGPLLLATQFELVSTTTSAGTLYGIAFVLYCLYLHVSLSQTWAHERRRQIRFMMTYSTIIMICALYLLVSNAWVIQNSYINHADFPGGPLLYEDSTYHTQPLIDVGIVCESVIDLCTLGIQIWRLWVVWSGTRYARLVVIVPALCFLAFTAVRIKILVLEITLINPTSSSQGNELTTADFALRTAAIMLPSVLIIGYLIFESRRQSKSTGKESQASSVYMRFVVMLVESFALEATWTILAIITYGIGHPSLEFFQETQTYIEIIAYFLVLYRLGLASKRAHGSRRTHGLESGPGRNMSTINWTQTGAQSCATCGNGVDTHHSQGDDLSV